MIAPLPYFLERAACRRSSFKKRAPPSGSRLSARLARLVAERRESRWSALILTALLVECRTHPVIPLGTELSRHPPDDRLRWAEIAAMGGHWQARTVAPSSLQGLPSAKSVTPALSASEMSISRSSRRTSPLVLADTHDSRTLTPARDQVVAGAARSAAGSRRTAFSARRPRPSGRQRSGRG